MNLLTFRNWGLGGGVVNSYFYHLVKDMLRGSLYTIHLSVLAPKICYEISIAYSADNQCPLFSFIVYLFILRIPHAHV